MTAGPTMSLDEARNIKADFKESKFVGAPRTINKLRASFQNGLEIPDNCATEREIKQAALQRSLSTLNENIDSKRDRDAWAVNLASYAELAMSNGHFKDAIKYARRGISALPEGNSTVRKAVLATLLARIHARLGKADDAQRALDESIRYWIQASSGGEDYLNSAGYGLKFANAGRAALAHAGGNLPIAEGYYRKAIHYGRLTGLSGGESDINVSELRSRLVDVLIQQRRLVEAEAVAREAVEMLMIYNPEQLYYSGEKAEPVAMLASVLLHQGKLKDAAYLARIAVNMHESSCSEPFAIGLTVARRILIDALGELGDWTSVLEQAETAKQSLKDYRDLFEREFASSLAVIEANFRIGDKVAALGSANRLISEATAEQGKESYSAAEIEGLIALAESESGNYEKALSLFSGIMAPFIGDFSETDQSLAGAVNLGRRDRILNGYLDLLATISETATGKNFGIDIASEMLRVVGVKKSGRVQQAFSAGWLRAATGSLELSKLVRQEQDLAQQVRSIAETLAFLGSAPNADMLAGNDLRAKLAKLRLARKTLREDILQRFPEFRKLAAPQTVSVDEVRSQLKPGQLMVAYHVAESRTFAWSISSSTKGINFAIIHKGREELSKQVGSLRQSVDPGPLRSLDDIPAFDVDLAHQLFELLLRPIISDTELFKELLIVADGPLGTLPFSMLVTENGAVGDDGQLLFSGYRKVAWLGRDLAVTNLPSVSAIKNIGDGAIREAAERRPFIGIGDPFFSSQQAARAKSEGISQVASRGISLRSAPKTRSVDSADLAMLPRLPDTQDEILAIAKALGADLERDIYLGARANEETIQAINFTPYDVISFATHGLVPGDLNGLDEPALALSAPEVTGGNGDGLLSMSEILGLRLDADFAVLSACNTAAADGAAAEAVSGLGRAFFYAGARALLVSNWPVHSRATTDLMSRMFKSIATDSTLTRSEALRRTKLYQIDRGGFETGGAMLFSYAHPIFWAPFTIVGDGGGATPATN